MKYRNLLICVCFLIASCSPKYKNPHVRIETDKGDIEVELFPDHAPKSVAAFLSYIDSGYYKETNFYRVLNDDNQPSDAYRSHLIQGGLWKSKYKLSSALPGIPHETTLQTKILHTDGTLSLARTKPGTATTEFFICIGDQHGFDYGGANNPDGQGYAAFGRVVKGMNIVKEVYSSHEDDQSFTPPVGISNIIRL